MLEMVPVYRKVKNIFLFQNSRKATASRKPKNGEKTGKIDVSEDNASQKRVISSSLGSKNRGDRLDHFDIHIV